MRRTLILGERAEALTVYLSALGASRGLRVLVADGANAFDPYLIARFARREGLSPEGLLRQIYVARAFTCHQLATLVRKHLDPMVLSGAPPLIALLGPSTLFLDQAVPREEATLLFQRMLTKVQEMKERGITFLMGQSFLRGDGHRDLLLQALVRASDTVLRLKPSAQIALEKPPGGLRRPWDFLEEFQQIA